VQEIDKVGGGRYTKIRPIATVSTRIHKYKNKCVGVYVCVCVQYALQVNELQRNEQFIYSESQLI